MSNYSKGCLVSLFLHATAICLMVWTSHMVIQAEDLGPVVDVSFLGSGGDVAPAEGPEGASTQSAASAPDDFQPLPPPLEEAPAIAEVVPPPPKKVPPQRPVQKTPQQPLVQQNATVPAAGESFGGSSGGEQGTEPGAGGGSASYLQGNYSYIQRHVRKKLVYPEQARRAGATGTVICVFIIGKDGKATDITVGESSGNSHLDAAVIRAVQRASPFPAPPQPARITLPITFTLK